MLKQQVHRSNVTAFRSCRQLCKAHGLWAVPRTWPRHKLVTQPQLRAATPMTLPSLLLAKDPLGSLGTHPCPKRRRCHPDKRRPRQHRFAGWHNVAATVAIHWYSRPPWLLRAPLRWCRNTTPPTWATATHSPLFGCCVAAKPLGWQGSHASVPACHRRLSPVVHTTGARG